MPKKKAANKMTIREIEAILEKEEDAPLEILQNGEIRMALRSKRKEKRKPLTMREDLGGEYAA